MTNKDAVIRELLQYITLNPEGDLTGKEFEAMLARAWAALDTPEPSVGELPGIAPRFSVTKAAAQIRAAATGKEGP